MSPTVEGTHPKIDSMSLDAFAAGSQLFATGAAELSFHLTLDWARSVLGDGVRVSRAADLPPQTICAAICLVGSSTALGERLPGGNEPVRVIRWLERRLGQKIGAIVALNLDAESALLPVITAALLGVPLVDGDGSGRVFPLIKQSTYTLGGVSATPLVMAGPADDVVVLDTAPDRVEELIRPLVLALGGWTVTACYPMTAEVLARVLVPGTVSRLMEAGVPGAPRSIAAPYGVRTLCRGRIAAVESSTGHGMDLTLPSLPSSIVVEEREGLGRLIRLEAHNEIVFALADGAMAAMAPDQICMISTVDGMAVDVDKVAPGLEVEVMVVRAAPVWHTEEGIALGGPQAFGVPL
ncbi:DUF917 domain-containing protein [Streptosporangium sp. 'caverna']|uniref:DUF917 domain-containing protein n=1 Tax=Streptosporangium sp. 'caverna' TaxID=2202249 RepID=UPI000D7D51DA|nr:DUF917 domain-containing protein [Streptosporangium sp. 'caverna']AWS42986.1 hypothetical protein DKM19_18055 [Streptosporangium sp. 'caverna']